jgi:cell division protein FtsI (penicillin-binding protein 3)
MAQYPFFIPDKYPDYFNDETLSERSKITAITDAREPGSPTKAFTVALALKANREQEEKGLPALFSPVEKISTFSGAFPGRSKPLKDVTCHRFLNLYMAMQKSSNIYMAILAQRMVKMMGEKWYREQLVKTFGLSTKTGVELVGESLGVLPVPGVLSSGWSKAAPYSLAIGYNLQTSALQMVRAYCVIANGGVLPELTLVRKVISEERGIVVDNTQPEREKNFPRVLERDDVKKLLQALRFVTKKGGTSSKADIFGYTEVGKSGTAMKLVNGKYSESSHFASFIGFAPAEEPAFVLYVALEEPWVGHITGRGFNHRGGTCAAPIFREIARRTLEFLGIREDDPYGYPSHDPRSDLTKADWHEEVEKLNMLYKKWNSS